MKRQQLYLDTSVLLARWAPLDPHHVASVMLIEAISAGDYLGYLSDFSLVEVAAVVERQQAKFSKKIPTLSDKTSLALEFIKRIILTPNLHLITSYKQSHILIADQKISLPLIYWKSIEVAITTKLRTLDAIHLSIASSSLALQGRVIDCFVTLDQEILKKAMLIKQSYRFSVISPEALLTSPRKEP